MHVREIMTTDVVACDVAESIQKAARLMKDKNVGCLVALENEQVAGILTDRDLALCLADGDTDRTVGEVMTSEVGRVRAEDDIFHLVDVFRSAGVVRRVPVVDDRNHLIGLVSVSDVALVAEDLINALLLEETHSAKEPHLLTGAKAMVKRMRRPSKAARMPTPPVHEVTSATVGPPTKK